jgi:DNA-binding transcriptional MerR regulator
MKTVKDLMSAAGASRRTIADWQARGLIPAPVVGRARGGVGRAGQYPDESEDTVRKIRRMLDRGRSLDEIAQSFQGEQSISLGQVGDAVAECLRVLDQKTGEHKRWEVEDRETGRLIAGNTEMTHRLEFRDTVLGIVSAMLSRSRAQEVANKLVQDDCLGWALELASHGIGPVLCVIPRLGRDGEGTYDDDVVFVSADFLLPHMMGATGFSVAIKDDLVGDRERMAEWFKGAYVLPLYELLRQALARIGQHLPSTPLVMAPMTVEMIKRTKDKKKIDAFVAADYSLIPIARGPYGRFVFAMKLPSARTLAK